MIGREGEWLCPPLTIGFISSRPNAPILPDAGHSLLV